jgi:hypothetical protein
MSVVTNKHDDYRGSIKRGERCNLCGTKVWYPFLVWDEERIIHICDDCCHKIRNGFIADLVQIAAIVDLRRLYPGFTLTRHDRQTLERNLDFQEKQAEITLLRKIDGNGAA